MQVDCFFTGGTGHQVCQDYARAGHLQLGQAWVALSDGCSSSPDTDVGARLLVLAASQLLYQIGQQPSGPVGLYLAECAWHARSRMPLVLAPSCLDATLLTAVEDFGSVRIEVAGDGLVVTRTRDGRRHIQDFDCNGAPPYLSYNLDNEVRKQAWIKAYGTQTVRLVGENVPPMVRHPWHGDDPVYQRTVEMGHHDLVLLLTDGVHSFRVKETQEPVPVEQVVDRILDFKSMTGEFLTRRMRTFLGRECRQLGWTHYDDVGVAAIYAGELLT